ncbi:MAG: NAD(P)(+) transhydrogenase (Re/Si-specific) subunit alpha, partial [Syntrophothermus sp.]
VEQTEEFKIKQATAIHDHAVKSDIIICTAQIPGRKAPVLIKKDTVMAMKPGSIILDLAASTGGNCELTQNDSKIIVNDVTILGNSRLATDMPSDASKMYGKNVVNFLKLMITPEGNMNLNWNDDLILGTCVTRDKQVVHEKVKAIHNL